MQPIRTPSKPLPIKSSNASQATATSKEPQQETELFHQSRNEAATKIQRSFRWYLVRHGNIEGIDLETRRQIITLMKKVASKVKDSSTARFVNTKFNQQNRNVQDMMAVQFEIYDACDGDVGCILNSLLDSKHAPCKELAQMLYLLLKRDPNLPEKFRNGLQIVKLNDPNSHVLLESHGVVIDPWIKYLDLSKFNGYRKTTSCEQNRERGYVGSLKDYLEFINHHKDSKYIKVDVLDDDIVPFKEAQDEVGDQKYLQSFNELVEKLHS